MASIYVIPEISLKSQHLPNNARVNASKSTWHSDCSPSPSCAPPSPRSTSSGAWQMAVKYMLWQCEWVSIWCDCQHNTIIIVIIKCLSPSLHTQPSPLSYPCRTHPTANLVIITGTWRGDNYPQLHRLAARAGVQVALMTAPARCI